MRREDGKKRLRNIPKFEDGMSWWSKRVGVGNLCDNK
jgi:hypothetical protein